MQPSKNNSVQVVERWLFHHDGTISDAINQIVLEVNKDQEIVVAKRSA